MSRIRLRMSRAVRVGDCAHALPEALLLAVLDRQFARLVVGDEAGDEIERQDAAAAHEHGADEHDPDQRDVEAGIIGDARRKRP